MSKTSLAIKLLPIFILAATATHASSNVLLKVRGQLLSASNTAAYQPTSSTANITSTNKQVINLGYGVEAAANYFINDNLAVEASIGIIRNKLATPVYDAAGSYTGGSLSKKSKVNYFIPATLLAQYHLAPAEQFSPYAGIGYSYIAVAGSSSLVKFKNLHGPVFQIGMDVWNNDDVGLNVDIKKYLITAKVKLPYLKYNGAPLAAKYTLNPWVISAGIGFRM
jgi:outer membrane protein